MNFINAVHQCSPLVHEDTMIGIVKTESNFNPYAIAEIIKLGGKTRVISHLPHSEEEAKHIIDRLRKENKNYSIGLAQINKANFDRFGVSAYSLLDYCNNLRVSQKILQECYFKYRNVNRMLSCYYSGNPVVGFYEEKGGSSYVSRVHNNFIRVSNSSVYDIKIPSLREGQKDIMLVKKGRKNIVHKKEIHKLNLFSIKYSFNNFSNEDKR